MSIKALRLCLLAGLLLQAAAGSALSQKLYHTWYFGYGAGLDFATAPPTSLDGGRVSTLEGCSVMCDDETGAILFYTDGTTVWNAQHRPMPDGNGLMGHWTSAQSAIIVPQPGHPDIYYIFTAGAGLYHSSDDNKNGFRYSIVDMRRDGGLGDVVEKNVELLAKGKAIEIVNATHHCNDVDFWVMSHGLDDDAFYVYKLTEAGVEEPVVSNIGSVLVGAGGSQSLGKFSPDGTMMALTTPSDKRLELFDFDNATGVLSNTRDLSGGGEYYGPEFSPDNSKLYTATLANNSNPNFVFQFDLVGETEESIRNSRVELGKVTGSWQGAQCQLAPDGKIYISFLHQSALSVINNPNVAGVACDYVYNAIPLTSGSTSHGLPNLINSYLGERRRPESLTMGLTADKVEAGIGDTVVYRLVICNDGIVEANGIDALFDLPDDLIPIDGPSTLQVVISSLLPGECDTIECRIRVVGEELGNDKALSTCAQVTTPFGTSCAPATETKCVDLFLDRCDAPLSVNVVMQTHNVYESGRSFLSRIWLDRFTREDSVGRIELRIRYDGAIALLENEEDWNDLTRGTLLEGWTLESIDADLGTLVITASTTDRDRFLRDSGTLLLPRFAIYLGTSTDVESPLEIELLSLDNVCIDFVEANGTARLDSLCGLNLRLIELVSGLKYGLGSPGLTDAGGTVDIPFTIALDAMTTLEIYDARGALVATPVSSYLQPGSYRADLDGAALPSGVYFCRLRSGQWEETKGFVVR